MKTLIALLALVALFSLTACSNASNDFDAEAEQETLESSWEEISVALKDGDRDVALKHYHDDWTFFSNPLPGFYEVSRATWVSWIPGISVSIEQPPEWMIGRDLAVRKSFQKWGFSKSAAAGGGFFAVDVFKKTDGQWQLMHSVMLRWPP